MAPETWLFPTSFAQQRLWFLDRLEPGKSVYNIFEARHLTASLDVDALRQALAEIVRRHESLRTTFKQRDGVPLQVIAQSGTADLPLIDLTGLDEASRLPRARHLVRREAERPFDLAQGPLMRTTLLRLGSRDHLLLLTLHHIISDGWSMGVLFREMGVLYEAFSAGEASPLGELPVQYADYAVWQREYVRGEVLERQLGYWKQRLAGAPAVLDLPTDRPRPALQSYRGGKQSVLIGEQLVNELRELSRREGVTMYMTLLAAFYALLYRYTGQTDIVVGTDVANRNHMQTEGLIGLFVNLLPIRTNLSGDSTFRNLLSTVREVMLEAYEHQDLPFEKIVEELKLERDLSRNPLVQVLFVLQNTPGPTPYLPGLTASPFEVSSGTSRFDLGLFFWESDRRLTGSWVYNSDLFNATTIGQISACFETLLRGILADPDGQLSTFEIFTEVEKRQRARQRSERRESQIKRLRTIGRKAVDLSQMNGIKMDLLQPGETLPLVVMPDAEGIDLVEWAGANRDLIEAELLRHGGILFRNFDMPSAYRFEQFAAGLCSELFGEYGDLPREGMGGKVYGSTPYPSDQVILFHNESSHLHRWPAKIWFFCVKAAEQGGETPILDCRRVYRLLDPKIRDRFVEKKLMYVRNYTDGLDVSWQTFFRTSDRAAVEDYCRKASIEFEWSNGNRLRTRQICPATITLPQTGERVFFNQIQLHHVSCLDAAVRESLLSMLKEEELPRNVYYGDGSAIEDSIVEELGELYRQTSVSFPWRQGDILMLNNMMVAHGRNPYVGERKIVVAMGEMIDKETVW